MSSIESRLHILESESAIRALKARYLNGCDLKDTEQIRACFTEDAEIDFPPLGAFGVNGLIEIFSNMAVSTPIIDVHQAHNGEINIDGNTARAVWNLSYVNFDPRENTFRLLSSLYYDEYQKTDQGWKISKTRSEPRLVVDGQLDKDTVSAQWVNNGNEG